MIYEETSRLWGPGGNNQTGPIDLGSHIPSHLFEIYTSNMEAI